jgi:hypothetical protein
MSDLSARIFEVAMMKTIYNNKVKSPNFSKTAAESNNQPEHPRANRFSINHFLLWLL